VRNLNGVAFIRILTFDGPAISIQWCSRGGKTIRNRSGLYDLRLKGSSAEFLE
jgi:hypothetical protein